MAITEIKILNFTLSLDVDNPEQLKELSTSLNQRLKDVSAHNHNASDIKLLIISALLLEDQVRTLKEQLLLEQSTKTQHLSQVKNFYNDAIDQIANYIDDLAKSVEVS